MRYWLSEPAREARVVTVIGEQGLAVPSLLSNVPALFVGRAARRDSRLHPLLPLYSLALPLLSLQRVSAQ
ncbi:uncharacterized protein ARMOST_07761 [Armillaria ostoyae]|uniref:Uncharacterized protein n=1 Tax=Armillaria ostoyae TaxID=47428 RepID=A0A284R6N4_ARMOS|nr:uncharacterized protein ARMOST_07761 [Armillaria ostoyae]